MKILIRADASGIFGSGHIFRCLTLAEELRHHGGQVTFACSILENNLIERIESEGFSVIRLPKQLYGQSYDVHSEKNEAIELIRQLGTRTDWDWMIIDQYFLGHDFESRMRKVAKKILVIDDLANRAHDCDILLDQNEFSEKELRYRELVPENATILCSPSYALLREEFLEAKPRAVIRKGPPQKILVFYGSADSTGESEKAVQALADFPHVQTEVVVGPQNRRFESIKKRIEQMPWIQISEPTRRISEKMLNADLMLSAGGITTWERCALALPAVVTIVSLNQAFLSDECEKRGYHRIAGYSNEVTSDFLKKWIRHFMEFPTLLEAFSKKGFSAVDCLGVFRVVKQMFQSHGDLIKAEQLNQIIIQKRRL